ncbi:MAG: hypothetical protein H8E94_02975 [Alphaproteobacteria bacterium]|nr:hypothetical protein [Alphaproteobacteria bacterium]
MKTLRVLAGGRAHGAGFFKDKDGYWSISMDPNEVRDITIDWTGWLEGDTVSTSAFAPTSLTENSESNTTTSSTCWVTSPADPYGYTKCTIVTASGRTKKLTIRVYYEVM